MATPSVTSPDARRPPPSSARPWLIRELPGAFGLSLRARYLRRRASRCGRGLRVLAGCRFVTPAGLRIGTGVEIGFDNFIDASAGVQLADGVRTATGVKILARADGGEAASDIVVGAGSFIGANAVLGPGVRLGEGCAVQAGSVLRAGDYPAFSVLAGNPGKVVGQRGAPPAGASIDASGELAAASPVTAGG